MRVLHLIASTERRGAEVFAVELAQHLTTHGFHSEVIALRGGGSLPVDAVGHGRFDARTLRMLRAAIRRSSVVVAHGSTTLLATCVVRIGTDVPFVYRNIGDPDHWVDTRFRSWRVRFMLRPAARIVALWPGAAARLVERHGLDPDRVAVAANAVDLVRFPVITSNERREARDELDVPADATVLAWIGALSAEKDPATAVRAAALVEGSVLLVVGDGPLRAEVEALAAASMPGRARFLSTVDDVRSALVPADVVLLTSRTEGLPAVLIEAGMSGLPVVATAVGGVAQIVSDGLTGVLVDPDDEFAIAAGVSWALAHRASAGLAARAHCEARFAMAGIVADWVTVLEGAVGARPEPS
jgi:glycosyltransferase involved in cell wall biosynthesis